MPEPPIRDQVPAALTWNLTDIYATAADWEADYRRVEAEVVSVPAYRGQLTAGPAALLAFLRERDALLERLNRVAEYARLHACVDGAAPACQAMVGRAGALSTRVEAALAFFRPEVLALPDGTVGRYLAAEPALAPYRLQLETIAWSRPHTLAAEAEDVLATLSETLNLPRLVHERTLAADVVCPPIRDRTGRELPMSLERYFWLARSGDREVRRRAYASRAAGLGRHATALATTLAAHVQRDVALARLRGYGSAAEMLLAPQQVPPDVYHRVLDTVHDLSAPHVRRLLRLRQRLLGIDQLHRYDLLAPLDPEYDPPATFEESTEMIRVALAPLGDEWGRVVGTALRDRWVDRADNPGKMAGAFGRAVHAVHGYVLMTWQGTLRDALILAHELGHAVQGYLASRSQTISNARPGLLFTEVPSSLSELMLAGHLLETATDPRRRRWVLAQVIDTPFLGTLTNSVLMGHLERRLYGMAEAGQPITPATLADAQAEVFERYFAGALVVDEGARLDWVRFPQYYAGLYLFTYAAGLCCACGVVDAIRRDGRPAADRWVRAVKAGGTLPPLELMRLAGVDMTSSEPIHRAVELFGRLIDELEGSFPEERAAPVR